VDKKERCVEPPCEVRRRGDLASRGPIELNRSHYPISRPAPADIDIGPSWNGKDWHASALEQAERSRSKDDSVDTGVTMRTNDE
jgi:hypothetical protein